MSEVVGTVVELWQYPVKSAQGHRVDSLAARPLGFDGDRVVGFVNTETGKLLSAKRHKQLLSAVGHSDRVELDDGTTISFAEADAPARLSAWLGVPVAIARAGTGDQVTYEMNFGPLDSGTPTIDIPAPRSTLLDLAAAHIVSTATLAHAEAEAPQFDWNVRRFRPNIVIDTGSTQPFAEDTWCGKQIKVGDVTLGAMMTTIRCAMPMRAQVGGDDGEPLESQPEMFNALVALHDNYLGIYLTVDEPGAIRVGDTAQLVG
ncbi:MAG TPA: MOSC domain-containing protein [Acidimicrobiales bacterium]|nr:MOSC domain-containing protein [Acidimicrobiales bacterium]